jgi:hypothetical protein
MGQDKIITQKGSEYNQISFVGGMNLLLDDTRLQTDQYRIGFDLTNRYDVLDPVLVSQLDEFLPKGIIQEVVTFGNYVIAFVSGKAYYRYYTDQGWQLISDFSGLSPKAPRYWSCAVPVSTTNYVRYAATGSVASTTNPAGGIQLSSVAGAAQGNLPGLLVQDNINQPVFIFIELGGVPTARVTQTFKQWSIAFTDGTNTVVAPNGDNREYVPVGNVMAYVDGILYIASQDGNFIYRSVSGRPLDFVINVVNTLATNAPYTMTGGGDATTTSYSVGVGPINCLRALSTGGVFVSAANACFSVTKNTTPNAPTMFGEYTFIRTFLFTSTCLSDRVIFDSIGDTRFIDLNGVRSFNAVEQLQNEGRNSPFTSTIQSIFGPDESPITQDPTATAAILYNNYELYSVNTILGPVIAKYDTLNNCWTSFDIQQTAGKAIKIFAKIELTILRLYAVTTDNKLYTLYLGPGVTSPSFRSVGVSANILWAGSDVKMAQPKLELKLEKVRVILNKVTENADCSMTPYFNNEPSKVGETNKTITFETPPVKTTDSLALRDVGTKLCNILYNTSDIEQAWKYFAVFSWSDGSLTQFSFEMQELTPENPTNSQVTIV